MTVLEARRLRAGYGKVEVLRDIDLHVAQGEVVAILGANGAGKTTTLRALAGVIPSTGTVRMFGSPAEGPLHRRASAGMAFLPETRGVVRGLSVEDNLRLARVTLTAAYQLSPELQPLRRRLAGTLSGGEQQILALTRALAGSPKLLMGDELSFGLAPIVVARMLALVRAVASQGTAVLLVEQYAQHVLAVADRAYVLQRGEVTVTGSAGDLLADLGSIESAYQGVAPRPVSPAPVAGDLPHLPQ